MCQAFVVIPNGAIIVTFSGGQHGEAVAGYIGNERRFEYTVIGDPVNEAARPTELAKSVSGGLLAAGHTVEAAGSGEARLWYQGEAVTLRGHSHTTRSATPIGITTPAIFGPSSGSS